MENVKDVVAAIIFKDNKVLITQRAIYDPLAGYWEFPGGKIEEGESPEESLIREMQEEFCIDIEVGEFFESSLFLYDKGIISPIKSSTVRASFPLQSLKPRPS